MKATHNPYVYDCGTCGKPVSFDGPTNSWKHLVRTATCTIESVVEVALGLLTKNA